MQNTNKLHFMKLKFDYKNKVRSKIPQKMQRNLHLLRDLFLLQAKEFSCSVRLA